MRKKVIKLGPEAMAALEQLRQAFIAKFGREPRPEDPIFFDPDADEPRPYPKEKIVADTVEAMLAAGMDPRLIWAYERTGLIVTEKNLSQLDPEDLQEWADALSEYDEAEKRRLQ